jgi:hypothetical protein
MALYMTHELQQEYPYTVIGFEFTEKDYHRYRIYQKVLDSLPNNVAWYGPGSLMDHVLSSQYNAVILNGYFRFKTESDKTFFLLSFS